MSHTGTLNNVPVMHWYLYFTDQVKQSVQDRIMQTTMWSTQNKYLVCELVTEVIFEEWGILKLKKQMKGISSNITNLSRWTSKDRLEK